MYGPSQSPVFAAVGDSASPYNDSWLDRYDSERTFFSGIVDADLGATTDLSAGYEDQKMDVNSPTWGGLPRRNTDGSQNSYDRAHSTAPDWAYNDKEINKYQF